VEYDKQAKIYLFGSRVGDNKCGGDIDLLIILKKIMRQKN
jgi:predicted nucleotidyltransferase